MEVTTERFIRKPLYVDAVRVTSQNFDAVAAWCDGEVQKETEGPRTGKSYIRVRVQYPKSPRQSKAFVGDWVLYTETGYKVYTNPSFRKSFDAAPVESKAAKEEERPATADEIREKLPHAQDRRPQPPTTEEPPSQGTVEPGADLGTTPQGEQVEVVAATPQAIADAVNEQQPPVELKEEDATCKIEQAGQPEPVVEEETTIAPPPTPAIVPPEVAPEPRLQTETDDEHKLKHEPVAVEDAPVSEQPPEDAAAGKRVLSEEEQAQMGPEAVREMVSTGDVVLAQDLAA